MSSRLLLVEDEAPVQELLAEYLRGRGYLVSTCSDGASARVALHGGPWDLLITDLKLPDAEGVELVRLAHQRTPALCSVVISGYASVENAVAALTAGAVEVLLKPFRLREAHGAVERGLAAAERQRWAARRLAVADWLEAAANAARPEDVAPLLADLRRLLLLHAPDTDIELVPTDRALTDDPAAADPAAADPAWRPVGTGHRLRCDVLQPAFLPWINAAHHAVLRCGL